MRRAGNPAEQERHNEQWALNTGAKRRPTCRVLVQKTEGCNHMECRCGAHFCWMCLQVFDHITIYGHLTAVHGGIDTPHVPQLIQVDQPIRGNEQIHANRPARPNQDDQPARMDAGLAPVDVNKPEADYEYALRLQREENLTAGLGVDINVNVVLEY